MLSALLTIETLRSLHADAVAFGLSILVVMEVFCLAWRAFRGGRIKHKAALAVFAAALCVCAQKPGSDDGQDDGSAPLLMSPPPSLAVVPPADDPFGPVTNLVTGLSITDIKVASTSLFVRVAWPLEDTSISGSSLDFYLASELDTDCWTWVSRTPVPASATGLAVEIPFTDLPGDGSRAFIRVGTLRDTDGDQQADAYEIFVSGSNPRRNDSDADDDGLTYADELGAAYVLPDVFLWFDVTNGRNLATRDGTMGYADAVLVNGLAIWDERFDSVTLYADGFTHLYRANDDHTWNWSWIGGDSGLSFALSDFSGGTITVAGCDMDAYVRRGVWGSAEYVGTVTTNDTSYDVIEYLNIGLATHRADDISPLISYEIIIPHDERGVIYVSYKRVDDGIRALNMELGVQCAFLDNPLAPTEFYTLMSPVAGSNLVAGTTVRYEIGTATSPFDPDSDDDGIADGSDPFPLDASMAYYGQCEEWVRENFTNADEILDVGYADWVDGQVGSGLVNGLYKLTVTVPCALASPVGFSVGDLHVAVTNAGEYVFLLEKGRGYPLSVSSVSGQDFIWSVTDDVPQPSGMTPLSVSSPGAGWTIAGGDVHLDYPLVFENGFLRWNPTFFGSPDIGRLGPNQTRCTFRANLVDYRYAQSAVFNWSGGDADIHILSPRDRETVVEVVRMPSWRSMNISVSAEVFGETLVSTLTGLIVGENDAPQMHLDLAVPEALLVNEGDDASPDHLRPMSLSCSSDIQTNGTYELSCRSDGGLVALWDTREKSRLQPYSRSWSAAEPCTYSAFVEGLDKSRSLGDVTFRLVYRDAAGTVRNSVEKNVTVIKVGDVVLPGEPEGGLVVLRGTSVAMEVECEPEGAGALLSTSWQTRRLKCDGTYSDWNDIGENGSGASLLYTPQTGGIYQVRSFVSLRNSPGVNLERRFVWSEDEPEATGICDKGELKAFGACDEMWQVVLRFRALSMLGSEDYEFDDYVDAREPYSSVGPFKWKCSIFVAHMICDVEYVGGIVSPVRQQQSAGVYPPLANEWAAGVGVWPWKRLQNHEYVQPGFVVGHPNPYGSGHCGIVDFDGWAISAGRDNVNRRFGEWFDTTSGYNRYDGIVDE